MKNMNSQFRKLGYKVTLCKQHFFKTISSCVSLKYDKKSQFNKRCFETHSGE